MALRQIRKPHPFIRGMDLVAWHAPENSIGKRGASAAGMKTHASVAPVEVASELFRVLDCPVIGYVVVVVSTSL
jgi:hypothetical protein